MSAHLIMGLIEGLKSILGLFNEDPLDRLVKDPYLSIGLEFSDNGKSGLSTEEYFKREIRKENSPLKTAINTINLYFILCEAIRRETEIIMAEIEQMKEDERLFDIYQEELSDSLALIEMQLRMNAEDERLLDQKKTLTAYLQQINDLTAGYIKATQDLNAIAADFQKAQTRLDNVLKTQEAKTAKIYETSHREVLSSVQNQVDVISRRVDSTNERLMRARHELETLSQGRSASDPLVVQKAQEVANLQSTVSALNDFVGFKKEFHESEKARLQSSENFKKLSFEDLKEKGVVKEDVTPQAKALKDVIMNEIRAKTVEMQVESHNKIAQKLVEDKPGLLDSLNLSDIQIPQKKLNAALMKKAFEESSKEMSNIKQDMANIHLRREGVQQQIGDIRTQLYDVAKKMGKEAPRNDKQSAAASPPLKPPPSSPSFPHN